ncbi:hypothetical protein AR687_17250 [Flavobacteriaceae bacterium CRH]|nr:hypothetical protein AR687_17250 [Flavobacteriaceae bacterium CRH]
MNEFSLFFKRFLDRIFKIEILTFLFFIVLTITYKFYQESHKYFNNADFPLNFQGICGYVVTLIYGFFFFLIIVFPFLFLLQLFFGIKFKILNKSKIGIIFILIALYLGSVIAVFSLYSVKQHQNLISSKAYKNDNK